VVVAAGFASLPALGSLFVFLMQKLATSRLHCDTHTVALTHCSCWRRAVGGGTSCNAIRASLIIAVADP